MTCIVFEERLDQHWVKACSFAHFGMALEIGTGGDTPHYLFDGQHFATPHVQGDIVDLLDEVRRNLFFIQQAKHIGSCDCAPARLSNKFVAAQTITGRYLVFADHIGQAFIIRVSIDQFGFAFGQ